MNDALLAYNELTIKYFPGKKLAEFFQENDNGIYRKMIAMGYGSSEVMEVIKKNSYGFKKSGKSIDEYIEPVQDQEKQIHDIPAAEQYSKELEAYAPGLKEIFLDVDADIVCDLKERNYSMKTILDAFDSATGIRYFLHNDGDISSYKNDVILKSNSRHYRRMYKDIDSAGKLYLKLLDLQLGKHDGYSRENLSPVREGSILLTMMIEHNVSIEIITRVLEHMSPIAKKEGEAYVRQVVHRLREIKKSYENIYNAKPLDECVSFQDIYCSTARKYMKKTGTRILCARDDEQIIGQLLKRNLGREQVINVIAASPVALEIGRKIKDYISNMSDYFKIHADGIKTVSMEEIRKKISERFEYYRGYFTYPVERELVHALVAKDLLKNEYSAETIKEGLKEFINDRDEGYISVMVQKSVNAVRAEQDVRNYIYSYDEPLSKDLIERAQIDNDELFRIIAKEKITDNPSFIRRWYYSMEHDADILETMLVKFTDTEPEKLVEIILRYSPRAIIAKDSEGYAKRVVEKLKRRLHLNQIGEMIVEKKKKEYAKKCGLATEGTSKESYIRTYVDGKMAVKLLNEGKSPLEVRNALMMVSGSKGSVQSSYADEILERAIKVKERLRKIASHVPKKAVVGAAVSLSLIYLDYVSEQYLLKGFLQSRMDIDAFYFMQQHTMAEPEKIKEVIREYSPVYIEPGRDENYLNFIEQNAQELLQEEERKLEYYRAVAREEHENYLAEYQKHMEDIQKNIDLAYCPEMDEIIAEAMMIQGFTESEISDALTNSPCYSEESYSEEIIEKARERLVDRDIVQVSPELHEERPEEKPEIQQQFEKRTSQRDERRRERRETLARQIVQSHSDDDFMEEPETEDD